ncbi:MAG: hypothetical protein R3C03_21525 [Pirellulaceae bacterium]
MGRKPQASRGKIIAPGIALIVVGSLGLIMSIVSIFMALFGAPPAIDPTQPEWLQDLQRNGRGTFPAIIQGAFVLLNIAIIAGGISMVRVKNWGIGLTATIAAMINFGNCCCVLGLPVGIWSLVILLQDDVKRAFESNK